MQNAKVKFIKNVTKTLSDRHTGEIIKQTKSSNDIEDEFLFAACRAPITGVFAPSPEAETRVINRMGFVVGMINSTPLALTGKKPSNSEVGVDLADGGDGTKALFKVRAYIEPESTSTVEELTLENDIGVLYATDPDNQEVTNTQRYTIDWEIAAVRCDEISP